MTKLVIVGILMGTTAAAINAQQLRFIDLKISEIENVWTYAVCPSDKSDSLTVLLEIPEVAYVTLARSDSLRERIVQPAQVGVNFAFPESLSIKVAPSNSVGVQVALPEYISVKLVPSKSVAANESTPIPGLLIRQERTHGDNLRIQFKNVDTKNQWIYFHVKAPKSKTRNGRIAWTVEPNCVNKNARLPGPIPNDQFVRPALTVGGSWRIYGEDITIHDDAVPIEFDGVFRPSLSVGLLLDLNRGNSWVRNVDFLLSIEFGVDVSRLIDGVVFGPTYRMSQYAQCFLGVSMRTKRNWRKENEALVQQLAEEINTKRDYSNSPQNNTQNKINPDVLRLTEYMNWVIVCGIAVPIDVPKLIDVVRKIPG